MGRYLLRRLVTLTITIAGIMVMTFFTSLVVPLDPLASLAGPQAPPETVERLRALYGFDQPLYVQFGRYVARLARGDLGVSFQTSRPVLTDILTYFPATLELATFAILVGIFVGIPLGVLSAVYKNRAIDQFCRLLSLIGVSTPVFWLGLVLMLVFYFKLGWLPEPGRLNIMLLEPPRLTGVLLVDSALARDWEVFADALKHLVLPASVLGLVGVAGISRITRSSMLEVLSQEYIKTARIKGLCASFRSSPATPCGTPWCRRSRWSASPMACCWRARSSPRPSSPGRAWAATWPTPSSRWTSTPSWAAPCSWR